MKKIAIIAIILSNIIFFGCRKEFSYESKDFPIFITNEVKNIDSNGVTLSATIIDHGMKDIVEYGFILYTEYAKNKYLSTGDVTGNVFEIRVNSLEKNCYQDCRSYVKTKDKTIYSNLVSFISIGSELPYPTITRFYISEFGYGNEMLIEGNDLNMYIDDREVLVNNQIPIIEIWNDTLIQLNFINVNYANSIYIRYHNIEYNLPIYR